MTSALRLFQGRFGRVALLDSDKNLGIPPSEYRRRVERFA